MPLEIRHLRYVVAAAERGSFRSAARMLGIQQSAVSRRIRHLEDEIGVALFVRDHAGVRLTQAGKRFIARARRALDHVKSAANDAASFGRGEIGVVRIGIFSSLACGFLADLLRTYAERNPSVRVDLIEGSPSSHLSALLRLQIDLAFLTGAPTTEDCESAHLWTERVFVVVPTKHRLASRRKLTWQDLRDHHFIVSEDDPGPEIHDYLVKHLADLSRSPSVERHAVGRDNLMNLVAMGQGLTLTSEAATAARFPGVAYRPLDGQVLPFFAIWSSKNDNPALRRLLSLAKSMSRHRHSVQNGGAEVTSSSPLKH